MSTAIFPSLAGLGFNVDRTPIWSTIKQQAVSGKETSIGLWSAPRWEWQLIFNFLRLDPSLLEFQQLVGFFNARRGGFDSFLFEDVDDCSVTSQVIGIGDGATTQFQMIREFGGFIEPVLAVQLLAPLTVRVNGTVVTNYSIAAWGSTVPGVITFNAPVANGAEITADFKYWFPCRFIDDTMTFNKFVSTIYKAEAVPFRSIK